MSGIYGIYSRNQNNNLQQVYNYFYSSKLPNILNEEFNFKNFTYGRSTINKFLNDRVLYEDDQIIVGVEGVLFNNDQDKSYKTLIKYFQEEGIQSISKLRGQFSGFIFDKTSERLFIFTDHLTSKPLYYYSSDDFFISASELKVITKTLTKLGLKKKLNYDAVYCMLTFGYMLNDTTYEENTKKLEYATILEVNSNFAVNKKKYFEYKKSQNYEISKKFIINKIDQLLTSSVKKVWSKNKLYNYKQYALLSGGLDSRVNVLIAKRLGFTDISTITFSQSGSSDDKIANKIAKSEGFDHFFFPLDNGHNLEEGITNYVLANDGLAVFHGAAAGYHCLNKIPKNDLGGIHSGQIGDVLFGSFITKSFLIEDGMLSDQKQLVEKISFIEELKTKYNNNPELFSFEQRQQNNTLNGDRTYSHIADLFSPFYDRDLIEFCLTIPDKYKRNEAIYLNWFNCKHKYISKYVWEGAGVKPKLVNITRLARFFKRYKNGFARRLGLKVNDVNPFDVWLRKNPNILKSLTDIYLREINKVNDLELKALLENIFNKEIKYSYYGRSNKFLVVTLLISLNIHFGE